MTNLYTITRYHGTNDGDLEKLWQFIERAQTYSQRILIGVNTEKDLTDCITRSSQRQHRSTASVDFIPIQPWIGISTPLNILLNHIPSAERSVLIQSVEIQCTLHHVNRLRTYLSDTNVLCVGVALDGHAVSNSTPDGTRLPLQGDTSPWNTFIIWNLDKLRRTGFPLCCDHVNPPGMEDSSVIGLQQKLFGGMEQNRALLVRFADDVHWLTRFDDDRERLAKHQMKMQSKNSRTKQLLDVLNISDSDHADRLGIHYVHDKSGQ